MRIRSLGVKSGKNMAGCYLGESTGASQTETTVTFDIPMDDVPIVVITPLTRDEIWITGMATTHFKWNNNSGDNVTVNWIAMC